MLVEVEVRSWSLLRVLLCSASVFQGSSPPPFLSLFVYLRETKMTSCAFPSRQRTWLSAKSKHRILCPGLDIIPKDPLAQYFGWAVYTASRPLE